MFNLLKRFQRAQSSCGYSIVAQLMHLLLAAIRYPRSTLLTSWKYFLEPFDNSSSMTEAHQGTPQFFSHLPILSVIDREVETPVLGDSSPVTWRVAFWVLLTLSINSMAQKAAFSGSHKFYLHSSPLFCLSETILLLIRISAQSISFKISWAKSVHLAQRLRMDNLAACKHAPNDIVSTLLIAEIQRTAWPRWLFFVMGTLPAGIKLASFSNLPWTKTWGMMFLCTFIVNEVIAITSSPVLSFARIFGQSPVSWDRDQHDYLSKVHSLDCYLSRVEGWVMRLARILHYGVVIWAGERIWIVASGKILASPMIQLALPYASLGAAWIVCLADVFDFILKCIRGRKDTKRQRDWRIGPILYPLAMVVIMMPNPGLSNLGKGCMTCLRYVTVTLLTRYWSTYWQMIVTSVCAPWQGFERLLWVSPAAEASGHEQTEERYVKQVVEENIVENYIIQSELAEIDLGEVDMAARHLEERQLEQIEVAERHLAGRKSMERQFAGGEVPSGEEEAGGIMPVVERPPLVDDDALGSLISLFTNLGVCIMWYAFMYDERDTVKPAWTDIFG